MYGYYQIFDRKIEKKMIDTVKIRIHGINDIKSGLQSEINKANGFDEDFILPHHNLLYRRMLQYKGKHSSRQVTRTRVRHEVNDLTDAEYFKLNFDKKLTHHFQSRDLLSFTEEKDTKTIFKNVTGKYEVPSSYAGVVYNVNDNQGFIEFQFSVPKYLFGHSLGQFVPQVDSDLYSYNARIGATWRFQAKFLYSRLMTFIKKFLEDVEAMFGIDKPIVMHYVELMRVDLCFNQYFEDKATAMKYVECLKKINHKRYKVGQKAPAEYNTSLEYTASDGSYFKVYHKGAEYSNSPYGDLKKHDAVNRRYTDNYEAKMRPDLRKIYGECKDVVFEAINARARDTPYVMDEALKERVKEVVHGVNRRLPFNVNFFKTEMDKVLRYEISLKGTFLSYAYKTKVFRKDCPVHRTWFDRYKRTKSIYDARNQNLSTQEVSSLDNKNYRMFHRWINRKSALLLTDNVNLRRFENDGNIDMQNNGYKLTRYQMAYTSLVNIDVGIFSEDMLFHCVKRFQKHVRYYQVDALTSYENLMKRIENHNNSVDARVALYNEENHYRTISANGRPLIKGNRIIKKATQLLPRLELCKKGLKKVSAMYIATLVTLLKKGKSMAMVRDEMNLSKDQWYRLKMDLRNFNITEQSLIEPQPVETCTDWREYYNRCERKDYKQYFFVKKSNWENG
jgi:hypothetical protein